MSNLILMFLRVYYTQKILRENVIQLDGQSFDEVLKTVTPTLATTNTNMWEAATASQLFILLSSRYAVLWRYSATRRHTRKHSISKCTPTRLLLVVHFRVYTADPAYLPGKYELRPAVKKFVWVASQGVCFKCTSCVPRLVRHCISCVPRCVLHA
jgi:hypothetical protein